MQYESNLAQESRDNYIWGKMDSLEAYRLQQIIMPVFTETE